MFKIIHVCADYGRLKDSVRSRFVDGTKPIVFSWGAIHSDAGAYQSECHVALQGEAFSWDSGWVRTRRQNITCEKLPPEGCPLELTITLLDQEGRESETYRNTIFNAHVDWKAGWISSAEEAKGRAVYLRREFSLDKPVASAVLYACGIGYQKVLVNGKEADNAWLDPAHTDYSKTCQYVMYPCVKDLLQQGRNTLGVMVADGWRRNSLTEREYDHSIPFKGAAQFTGMLRICYSDGTEEILTTDEGWETAFGAWQSADLFNGATCDATKALPGWAEGKCEGFTPAAKVPSPGGEMKPMLLNPILPEEAIAPLTSWRKDGTTYFDFGRNIAGVVSLQLPGTLQPGQTIVIRHAEELEEDGSLFTAPLREAEATDRYIASGNGNDMACFCPLFTYHGFRYVSVTGLEGGPTEEEIRAIPLHTDLATKSFFRCGDPAATAIHDMCVATERANQHSILTDCPQRDERMGWMNDATVRFEETPYNFEIGRMFPKLVRDIMDEQGNDGAITCTAPLVFGNRPADPVCSSFLVAGYESWLHLDNLELLREAYDAYAGWEECLLNHSDGYLVNYSYYGDWAGPRYACVLNSIGDGAQSKTTPGEFMSSGYSYLNCKLLAKFAEQLEKKEETVKWTELANKIKEAMLSRWYNPTTGGIATDSQGCLSFALWLDILPEGARAAKLLRDNLVESQYQFTTGNLCTRYMMDVLTKYGYLEEAWTLLTKKDYPSYGYMLEQEATTVWERFELKKDPGMNSHNHPMYGAVDYWFYAYLCGIQPVEPGYAKVRIHPYFPQGLMSAQASVDTVRGPISVRWVKRYKKLTLQLSVPFGCEATVEFADETHTVGSGFYTFDTPCEEA